MPASSKPAAMAVYRVSPEERAAIEAGIAEADRGAFADDIEACRFPQRGMRLRYTRLALADREAIFDYLHQRSPQGARRVMARIDTVLQLLLTQPRGGYATDMPDVRVLFVGRYPYKAFYRIRGETIEVLRLWHTSRRPPEEI